MTLKLSRAVAVLLLMMIGSAPGQSSAAVTFDGLRQRAGEMAGKAYSPATGPQLPKTLETLGYDGFKQIRFRPEAAPWHNQLKFDLRLFSRGYIYRDPVKMHLVEGVQERDLRFTPSLFSFGGLKFQSPLPSDLDFAGFSIVYRNSPRNPWSEVASFLGASYFRIVGDGLRYGASARALALDTGEPAGEEFPRFTEFWVETPGQLAEQVMLLALLDSPSVAGACRFIVSAGERTSIEADVSLFPRAGGKKYGIAPLTSMFLMGENRTDYRPDFRPEVHDSDGLLVVTSGETFWRPLENPPKRHRITRFPLQAITGFGLMQRDRSFASYEDLEARYDLRPSLWIEPLAAWGEGTLELVEIPTPEEYNDNIVAYWVPAQKPEPGGELRFRYRLTAFGQEPASSLLKVTGTRIIPAGDKKPERFVVDFDGQTLNSIESKPHVQPRCTVKGGEVKNVQAIYNGVTDGWRVILDYQPTGDEPREIRLYLEAGGKRLSETWVQDLTNP